MTNKTNQWAKNRRAALIKIFGGRCFFCGATENLEFAHTTETELRGKGRGRKERLADISINRKCYVLACANLGDFPGCHTQYDAGELELIHWSDKIEV